jgi:hypothetical protein
MGGSCVLGRSEWVRVVGARRVEVTAVTQGHGWCADPHFCCSCMYELVWLSVKAAAHAVVRPLWKKGCPVVLRLPKAGHHAFMVARFCCQQCDKVTSTTANCLAL